MFIIYSLPIGRQKYSVLLSVFVWLWGWAAFATHNRAGEITYKWISGTKYEIIVTTYTRCTIEINYGDGSLKDTIERINGSPCSSPNPDCNKCGEIFPNNPDVKKNIYKTTHNFPGTTGTYIISVDDPNRNEGVENFPNSVNTSFYIESTITINPFLGSNSSPILDFPPIDIACANQLFEHNPGAHDPDGDVLVFSIVPNRGAGGSLIIDYSLPNQVPGCGSSSLSINSSTGLLSWNNAVCCHQPPPAEENENEFNLAILIEEYRTINGVLIKIGSVLRDMQVTVVCDCNNEPPLIISPSQLCVYAGDTIDTLIKAKDPNGDLVTMTASGEPLSLSNNPATFLQPVSGLDSVTSVFHWNTNCGHVRNNSYSIIFRAEDNHPKIPLVDYHTLDIKIIAPRVENPVALPIGNNIKLNWDASKCTASGYKIYRRIDSSGFTVSSCQTGLPSGTGYLLIANCINGNNYTDNNNGAGLNHGQKYCYVIVACLSGGAENVVSEEFCTELKNDVPVITNVSVFETDVSTGKDSIVWAMPKELDTLQYGKPYQYKIYRSSGFSNAATLIGTTAQSDVLALTDTIFTDNIPHDTKSSLYTYKIELYSNGTLVGNTQNASSVFLKSSPTDNALQLSWQENVPWVNSKYFIYKKNPSGTFDFLDTAFSHSYKDTGLINGEEYCYYLQSFGTYSSPGIIDTILNNSQILCDKPYDNVPPCPPITLKIEPDCEQFQSLLKWNNPNNNCSDDVVGYKIYYTPVFGKNLSFIQTNNSSGDTDFVNINQNTIAGCYAVSALDTNNNESSLSDTICLDNCPIYELPNVFTPGNDGKNDFFHPFPYRYIQSVNLQIFNRWGEIVFESTDPQIMWDGKNKKSKTMVPSGVYFYVCQVHAIRLNGIETFLLKGYVQMLTESGVSALPNN